jgi:hypothetical protein
VCPFPETLWLLPIVIPKCSIGLLTVEDQAAHLQPCGARIRQVLLWLVQIRSRSSDHRRRLRKDNAPAVRSRYHSSQKVSPLNGYITNVIYRRMLTIGLSESRCIGVSWIDSQGIGVYQRGRSWFLLSPELGLLVAGSVHAQLYVLQVVIRKSRSRHSGRSLLNRVQLGSESGRCAIVEVE